jgi:hypothetical protein
MGDRASRDPGAARELAALAERFFDLWQDQLAAWASDPQLVSGWERLWASWLMQTGGIPPADDGGATGRAGRARTRRRGGAPPAEAGAAPAAPASGHDAPDLSQLLARLGTLEERLAAMESGTRPRRPVAQARPRRRRL